MKLAPRTACGTEPAPALAAVVADGRAAHADGVALGEVERQRAPRPAPHAEMPVKPVPGRVAQVLMQKDVVALDAFHHDIAAGEIGIDLQLLAGILVYRGQPWNKAHDDSQREEVSHRLSPRISVSQNVPR